MDTDEEVADLAGCEIYMGRLHLRRITDLSPLTSLRAIRGGMGTGGYDLSRETLDGLESVESLGEFTFLGDGLRDLSGMRKLREVEGFFRLRELPNLEDVRGLEQLRFVGGNFDLSDNPMLANLDGLAGLEEVGGNVSIKFNHRLPQSEIDEFLAHVKVGGEVYLE